MGRNVQRRIGFSIPADFSLQTVDAICEDTAKSNSVLPVVETYGALPDSCFKSGRHPSTLRKVTWRQLVRYVQVLTEAGVDFNYLLNMACNSSEELTDKGQHDVFDFLKRLEDAGVTRVTIAIPSLVPVVCKTRMKVSLSTISDLYRPAGLEFCKLFPNVDRLCLPERLNRNLPVLRKVVDVARPLEISTIVNNTCLLYCPFRANHYQFYAHAKPVPDFFIAACALRRLKDPSEVIRAPWIRPEDIQLYIKAGISLFKIAGRGIQQPDFIRMVQTYRDGSFNGNIVDLLFAFSPNDFWKHFKISSKDVSGLFNKMLYENDGCNENNCITCKLCSDWSRSHKVIKRTEEIKQGYVEFYRYCTTLQ